MADCFISYSARDDALARFVQSHLQAHDLTVFLASVSIGPGEDWSERIWSALRESPWVVFLASRSACQSPFVLQELGCALGARKKIVPIIWEISPSDLPGWVARAQALDLRSKAPGEVEAQLRRIAEDIKADKACGALITGAVIAGLLYLAFKA